MEDTTDRAVGLHTVRFESATIVQIIVRGDVRPDDVHQMAALVREYGVARPYLLLLVDLREQGRFPPDARRVAEIESKQIPYRGMAFYHASFHVMLLIRIIILGMNLLSPHKDNPFCFCRTEAEARAWLAQRQRELLASEHPGAR